MVNLLLYRPNDNLKKIFGPTRPGNTPFGHAFIFGRILTLEMVETPEFRQLGVTHVLIYGLRHQKCSKVIPSSSLILPYFVNLSKLIHKIDNIKS